MTNKKKLHKNYHKMLIIKLLVFINLSFARGSKINIHYQMLFNVINAGIKGVRIVQVRNTGNDKARFTMVSPRMADVTKLKLTVICGQKTSQANIFAWNFYIFS